MAFDMFTSWVVQIGLTTCFKEIRKAAAVHRKLMLNTREHEHASQPELKRSLLFMMLKFERNHLI